MPATCQFLGPFYILIITVQEISSSPSEIHSLSEETRTKVDICDMYYKRNMSREVLVY